MVVVGERNTFQASHFLQEIKFAYNILLAILSLHLTNNFFF